MSTTTLNGKPQRKQLTDQLDRLDNMIDLLAEGLPAAVADACREGARAAIKDAILEVMTNPELRALIVTPPATSSSTVHETPPASSPKPAAPSLWSRLKSKVNAAKAAVIGAVVHAKNAVVSRCHAVRDAIKAVGLAGGEAVHVRKISVTALAVGIVVGITCLIVPEEVAAIIGGLGAAGTAVGVQVGCWLRRAVSRIGLLA